jgi:hypothetical protein
VYPRTLNGSSFQSSHLVLVSNNSKFTILILQMARTDPDVCVNVLSGVEMVISFHGPGSNLSATGGTVTATIVDTEATTESAHSEDSKVTVEVEVDNWDTVQECIPGNWQLTGSAMERVRLWIRKHGLDQLEPQPEEEEDEDNDRGEDMMEGLESY